MLFSKLLSLAGIIVFGALTISNYTFANNNLYKNIDGFIANVSDWNIAHLQLGLNVKRNKFNRRLSGYVSYAKLGQLPAAGKFDDPKDEIFLNGATGQTSAQHFSIGVR